MIGKEGLMEEDRQLLALADQVERDFINQGSSRRSISETLDLIEALLGRVEGAST